MQVPATTAIEARDKRSLMQGSAGKGKFLAAGLLQVAGTSEGVVPGAHSLLSVKQAAALLGLCAATVYKLCAEGELSHVRIPNTIRILPADLARFVQVRRSR